MDDIVISYNDFDELIIGIKNLIKEYNDNYSTINDIINNIQDNNIWVGKDNIVFTEHYKSYIKYFDKVLANLEDYYEYLNNTSLLYKNIEKEYGSKNIDG